MNDLERQVAELKVELSTLRTSYRRVGRILRTAVFTVLLGLAAMVALGERLAVAESGKEVRTVEAEKFVLVDAEGRTVAVLGKQRGGMVGLGFFDKNGKQKAVFGLKDKAQDPGIFLFADGKDTIPTVEIFEPGIRVNDINGKNVWTSPGGDFGKK